MGYGTPFDNLPPGHVLLKLDFKIAFNSIRRDKVLQSAIEYVPEIYPFIYACYSASSSLILSDTIIESAEGVQQGDPLGSLLCCLAIHPLILCLKCEFCLFYLDDGIVGGVNPIVLDDFLLIEKEAALLGLRLNRSKTELICVESASSNCCWLPLTFVRSTVMKQSSWGPLLVVLVLLMLLLLTK